MTYDPFARGPFPVGVQTLHANDPARNGRALAIEVWYPATDAHVGQDVSDESRHDIGNDVRQRRPPSK